MCYKYEPRRPQAYRIAEVVTIHDYQVICSVDVAKETPKAILIGKAEEVEVKKLLSNIYDSVKDKINAAIDAEVSADADGPDSGSDSAESEKVVEKRPLVKAKRQILAATQAVNKSAPAKKATTKRRAAKKDESDEEGSESEADLVEVQKKVGKKRTLPTQLASSQPNARKVRKLADSSSKNEAAAADSDYTSKPVKKAAKKPAVFKLGKWNPDSVLLERE